MSVRFYGTHVAVIYKIKESISKPLAHVVNSSLFYGNFTNKLKIAKVNKKMKNNNVSNYRPISKL